ncbi:MAG: methyltransferase domain-containing protein [Pseudomonadota bacterium]|nr:methyltransferase domain-containing protein [Pseudomonadota bacterium]
MSPEQGYGASAPAAHPSYQWTCTLRPGPGAAQDPERFERAMRHPDYPLSSAYNPYWVFANLMGPNCLWLVENLAREIALQPGQRVLDLGCGAALTSIFLSREHDVEVWAADLWVEPGDNHRRVLEAGLGHRVFPLRAEAHSLPFAPAFFDAVVSVDAFHYFGTDVRYLSYLAQFVKPGGRIGIVCPANAIDPDEGQPSLAPELFEQFGADWFTFRSLGWWRRHWTRTRGVSVERALMIPQGRELWRQSLEAAAAWSGIPVADQPDARLLFSEAGSTLGFCQIVARRGEGHTLEFGPGDFATRIA